MGPRASSGRIIPWVLHCHRRIPWGLRAEHEGVGCSERARGWLYLPHMSLSAHLQPVPSLGCPVSSDGDRGGDRKPLARWARASRTSQRGCSAAGWCCTYGVWVNISVLFAYGVWENTLGVFAVGQGDCGGHMGRKNVIFVLADIPRGTPVRQSGNNTRGSPRRKWGSSEEPGGLYALCINKGSGILVFLPLKHALG